MAQGNEPPDKSQFYIPSADVDKVAAKKNNNTSASPTDRGDQKKTLPTVQMRRDQHHHHDESRHGMSPSQTVPLNLNLGAERRQQSRAGRFLPATSMTPSFRSRTHSAPSILYQQVGLQLRNISDDYNEEYTSLSQVRLPII